MQQRQQLAYDEPASKAPACTERRHKWSIALGVQGSGDANIFTDACEHCGSLRIRRRSYRAIADPRRATGDGRDHTRYQEAYTVEAS